MLRQVSVSGLGLTVRPGPGAGADAHQQGIAQRWRYAAAPLLVALHLIVHPIGGAPQRQLAQGDKIAFAEEMLNGAFGLTTDPRVLPPALLWAIGLAIAGLLAKLATGW